MMRIAFLSLIIIITCSCSDWRSSTDHVASNLANVDPQHYAVNPSGIQARDIHVQAVLKDELKDGKLVLYMDIENNSDKSIRVEYENCSLNIDAERVVVPETTSEFKRELLPAEQEHYEITYHPINHVDFYFLSDYRGDMKQQYGLNLDFIVDDEGLPFSEKSFTFKMDDSSYQNYLTQYAREKHMQIFDFDFDGDAFAARQVGYLTKILPTRADEAQHNVIAITPSITIDQVVMKMLTYKYKDTLMVDVRMLNQGSQSIKVSLSNSTIDAAGAKYALADHFSDSFDSGRLPDSTYIFKPGTRLHLLLKYSIPFDMNQWKLADSWLSVHNNRASKDAWSKLFYDDISFKESSITKDPPQ